MVDPVTSSCRFLSIHHNKLSQNSTEVVYYVAITITTSIIWHQHLLTIIHFGSDPCEHNSTGSFPSLQPPIAVKTDLCLPASFSEIFFLHPPHVLYPLVYLGHTRYYFVQPARCYCYVFLSINSTCSHTDPVLFCIIDADIFTRQRKLSPQACRPKDKQESLPHKRHRRRILHPFQFHGPYISQRLIFHWPYLGLKRFIYNMLQ